MTVDSVQCPCLCILKGIVFTVASTDSLTTTTASGLRAGRFDNLQIIDSTGREFLVRSAKKLHGVGPFWGYNIFLNQRIRVALEIEATNKTYSTDEVRQIVLRDFESWHGWESRVDFDELKDAVKKAKSSAEILRLVN